MTKDIITSDAQDTLLLRQLLDHLLDIDNIAFFQQILDIVYRYDQGIIDKAEYSSELQEMWDKTNTIKIKAVPPQTLMRTHQLQKKYGNFELGPIDIELSTGDVMGLVGENGNGKTTLLRMIAMDLSITSGSVEYPFSRSDDEYALRTQLVYIPQRTPKWYGAVRDNLVFCALLNGESKENVDVMVEIWMLRFGIWRFRNHKWSALSSGYKMRFELVRAFLRHPSIVLIDEPLANLDILAQQMILEDLHMLVQSKAYPKGIILSSQQLYDVENITKDIIFLKGGKVNRLQDSVLEQAKGECILEIECDASMDQIHDVLSGFEAVNIDPAGMQWIISIRDPKVDRNDILRVLFDAGLDVPYYRDITHSSRRFFTSKNL